MKKIILFYFFFSFLFFFNKASLAEVVNNVAINGNQRIQNLTILEYANIKLGKDYSANELNEIQKRIYETGFFEQITITLKDKKLFINVVENPLVDFFNIQGEIPSDELNNLYDKLILGSNKVYSDYKLRQDLEFIKNYYTIRGYEHIEVKPRISKLNENKVNILINIEKNEQSKINNIYFIGNKIFDRSELLGVISSSEYSWWKFLSTSSILNNDKIEYDKTLLKKYYLNNGYYDVQITSVELKKISKYKTDIIFSINSGSLYNFGNFTIPKNENYINKNVIKFIEDQKKKHLSKVYSSNQVNKFVEKVNDYISLNEKIEFVEVSIKQNKNNNKIDLELNINLLNRNYINRIDITGNDITDETVIRQGLYYSEGDSYLNYKTKKSEDNLRSKEIFKNVKIYSEKLDDNKVDIKVNVEEKPTGSISASAGYGTLGGSIGFGISENNFLGKGIKTNTNLNLGTQKIDGFIQVTIPDYNYSDKTLFTKLYSQKTDYKNSLYESRKSGAEVATRYEVFENIYFKPGFGLDFETIKVDTSASNFMKSQAGSFDSQKIKYSINNDLRDQKIGTRSGYLTGFEQEIATFFSDIQFIQSSIYINNYFPITEKHTLKLNNGFSNIFSTNNKDIKLSDRLSVPYTYTKGFDSRAYGPLDNSSRNYIGGNNYIYSSLTSTFPNPLKDDWNLDTFAFINAFNLWGTDDNSSVRDSNKIRSAFGIGIDWMSPLGPLNINLATPITKDETDKTRVFSFQIGTTF